jgi:hypothetical protein
LRRVRPAHLSDLQSLQLSLGSLQLLGRLVDLSARPCAVQLGLGFLQLSLPIIPVLLGNVGASPRDRLLALIEQGTLRLPDQRAWWRRWRR